MATPPTTNTLLPPIQDGPLAMAGTNDTGIQLSFAAMYGMALGTEFAAVEPLPAYPQPAAPVTKQQDHSARLLQTDAEQYQCLTCGQTFKQKAGLNRHLKRHSGETPFKCTVCSFAFSRADHLKKHLRVHTGERPYVCNICTASFAQAVHLTRHNFIHTGQRPHECPQCPSSFARKEDLKNHIRLHTGEKPHKCTYCDAEFPILKTLKLHVMGHTGERPHRCGDCDAGFKTMQELNSHLRKHGGRRRGDLDNGGAGADEDDAVGPFGCFFKGYGCTYKFSRVDGRNAHEENCTFRNNAVGGVGGTGVTAVPQKKRRLASGKPRKTQSKGREEDFAKGEEEEDGFVEGRVVNATNSVGDKPVEGAAPSAE
ncbi:hypothetical protein BDR26DRAFT_948067 [Obelidium mucronatum]|nr:hypothetical protein BDR26DRAFT_948067 [Obelidium mucronatum]